MSEPRSPSEAKPPRMQALSRLPLFFAFEGKRTLVAGGGTGAAWKAELLSATGAAVDVYAEHPSEEMQALAAEPPKGSKILSPCLRQRNLGVGRPPPQRFPQRTREPWLNPDCVGNSPQ